MKQPMTLGAAQETLQTAAELQARLSALKAPGSLPPTEEVMERLLHQADGVLQQLRALEPRSEAEAQARQAHLDALISAAFSLTPSQPEPAARRPAHRPSSTPKAQPRRLPLRRFAISPQRRMRALSATFACVTLLTFGFHFQRVQSPSQLDLDRPTVIRASAAPEAREAAKAEAEALGKRVISIPDGPTLILPATPTSPRAELAEVQR